MRSHYSRSLARGAVVAAMALAALSLGATTALAQGSPQPLFSAADWQTVQSYFAAHPDASWNDFAASRSARRRCVARSPNRARAPLSRGAGASPVRSQRRARRPRSRSQLARGASVSKLRGCGRGCGRADGIALEAESAPPALEVARRNRRRGLGRVPPWPTS
jgi:hypothetical protein